MGISQLSHSYLTFNTDVEKKKKKKDAILMHPLNKPQSALALLLFTYPTFLYRFINGGLEPQSVL